MTTDGNNPASEPTEEELDEEAEERWEDESPAVIDEEDQHTTLDEVPDAVRRSIERFELHPSVKAPVTLEKEDGGYVFRATVPNASSGADVEVHGSTIEEAWHDFQTAMSQKISEAAANSSSPGIA